MVANAFAFLLLCNIIADTKTGRWNSSVLTPGNFYDTKIEYTWSYHPDETNPAWLIIFQVKYHCRPYLG